MPGVVPVQSKSLIKSTSISMTDDENIDVSALLEHARAWCSNLYSCDEEGEDLFEQLREAQRDLGDMLRLCRNPASVFHKDRDSMQAAWEPVLDDVDLTLALMDGEFKERKGRRA
jgi:sugar/nucleoside kinase (ribokinase family)